MRVSHLGKTFTRRRGLTTSEVVAVDDVSFTLERGKITSLVGQSGSGKSTIAKLIMGMEKNDTGEILFGNTNVRSLRGKDLHAYRSHVQMVFQDPYSALNPAHTVLHSLVRPLQNYKGMSARQARTRALEMLEAVGLTPAERFADRNPHQLSGGQRQRVVDGAGPRAGPGDRDRRRADVDARRHDPGRDPGDPEPSRAGQRHRHALHHPRPAQRAAACR